ncbi:MAG: bifunctional phosphatase chloroplastic [Patescibacteria group bacterium]|nr:bifunctional phosphatase chloroplastic [Patescibacteria group bacterium]
MRESPLATFGEIAPKAVLEAMRVVAAYQRGAQIVSASEMKQADASLVTEADHACEAVMVTMLRAALPNVPILGEEDGWTGEQVDAPYFIIIDPIDGTRSFATGTATSTTMVALYSRDARQLVGAAIGHPATGRVWVADNAGCRRLVHGSDLADTPQQTVECRTWPGELSRTTTVLIDKFRPFKAHSGTKQVLCAEGCLKLYEALFDQVVIQSYGSNGFHQAMVADGAYSTDATIGVAAGLTLGMGSWWDCAGALLVLRAGGAARGFWVTEQRQLEQRDPLDPTAYDMLLVANNERTLEALSEVLVRTFA